MELALNLGILALGLAGLALLLWRKRHERSRLLLAILLEQVRREEAHHVPYRYDQRELALRQRLSREIGPRANSTVWRERIARALEQFPERTRPFPPPAVRRIK